MPISEITPELQHVEDPNFTENSYVPKGVYFSFYKCQEKGEAGEEGRKRGHLGKKKKYPTHYLLPGEFR